MDDNKFVFEKICRACMQQSDSASMLNLFDNYSNGDDLAKIYETFTNIEAKPSDGLPPNVCSECYTNLNSYNIFRSKCIISDTLLRKQSVFIKIEPTIPIPSPSTFDQDFQYDLSIEDTKFNIDSNQFSEQESKPNIFDIKSKPTKKKVSRKRKKNDENNCPAVPKKQTQRERKKVYDIIYQCDMCTKKFFMKHRLEAHLRIHQGLKPYYCKECGRQFRKTCSLREHMKYHHSDHIEDRHKCIEPGCDRTYKMEKYLLEHIKVMHTDQPLEEKIPKFICELCGKAFHKRVSLTKHVFTHTRESEYACTVAGCSKKFPTKYKLEDHQRRHGGVRPFVCSHCGLTKYTQRELRIHVNLHTRETVYPCDKCPSVFGSKNNLWRHERIIHQGIRAFICNYCQRSFGKAETLKHHVMIHTGEKPHVCECGKRFIQIVALKRHQKTHYKQEPQ